MKYRSPTFYFTYYKEMERRALIKIKNIDDSRLKNNRLIIFEDGSFTLKNIKKVQSFPYYKIFKIDKNAHYEIDKHLSDNFPSCDIDMNIIDDIHYIVIESDNSKDLSNIGNTIEEDKFSILKDKEILNYINKLI